MIHIFIVSVIVKVVVCDLSLTILHTNDMHARFVPIDRGLGVCKSNKANSCYGGFARLHEVVKYYKNVAKSKGRSSLFLNAGDTFKGTQYYNKFKWHIVAKLINSLGIDVMCLGNHEFDDGVDSLADFIRNVKIPIVCSNLDHSKEPALNLPNLTSSKVLNVNGTKVGIIGYLTPSTIRDIITKLNILDEITSVKEEATKLKNQGVNILIALGHSGYVKDMEIAEKVEEIDVVIGGHSHTFLYTGTPPDIDQPSGPYPTIVTQKSGKKVPVLQAYTGTKYLGYLELNFDNKGQLKSFNGLPILLSGNFSEDPNILQELQPFTEGLDKSNKRIIGYTHVLLDNDNYKCKLSECELGNMITDAFVEYMSEHCESVQPSVGLIDSGGIRASIDSISRGQNGSVTEEDIFTVLPWGNHLVVLSLPGKVLLEVLEYAVDRYELTKIEHVSNFLQVSGLRVKYNLKRGRGNRVTDVKVLCYKCKVPWLKPLDKEEVFGVVVTEYMANGGSGFSMLSNYTRHCVSKDVDYAIVSKYIQTHSPVNPHIEDRILNQSEIYLNNLILPIYSCFFVVLIIIMIFKNTSVTPSNPIFCKSTSVSPTTSVVIKCSDEFNKLLYSQPKKC